MDGSNETDGGDSKADGASCASGADAWCGERVLPGETRNVDVVVGASFSGVPVEFPVQVRRALKPGPSVFVSAALHGDEINGTGAIRQLIQDASFELVAGTLVLAPVLNIPGFERHSRYMPDRRDLNRAFPGSAQGSSTSRAAHCIFQEIVCRCDFGIDIHTAAKRRTNYPNVRADLNDPQTRRIAEAFGGEVIINGRGPTGSLRREACRAGCPTIVFEGGEVSKVEPGIVEAAIRGIQNVLVELGMCVKNDDDSSGTTALRIEKTRWMRAENGGFLQFHVKPGDLIDADQALATNTSLLGEFQNTIHAPFRAVVLGMTTLPAISPGEPICHLGRVPKGAKLRELQRRRAQDGLEAKVAEDLASNLIVVDHEEG